MILRKPLDWVSVTQPFGAELITPEYPNGVYAHYGMKGHNGIDLRASIGKPYYATHDGVITVSGDTNAGKMVINKGNDNGQYFETLGGHLSECIAPVGKKVVAGEVLGLTGNTTGSVGVSTAPHLHFQLNFLYETGTVMNYNNGYQGGVNPAPYMEKDWLKWPVELRYNQPRNWNTYLQEVRAVGILWAGLKRKPTNLEVSAFVYGHYSLENIRNPLCWSFINWMTKERYLAGDKSYLF